MTFGLCIRSSATSVSSCSIHSTCRYLAQWTDASWLSSKPASDASTDSVSVGFPDAQMAKSEARFEEDCAEPANLQRCGAPPSARRHASCVRLVQPNALTMKPADVV